jgi:hypothetical protein
MTEYCSQERFTAQGEPRAPIVDLRFTGTLQFSRGDFRTDELSEWLEDTWDALYVQVNTGIRTANVQQLLSEIDEEDVFKDGKLNTAVLEDRVFETIAKESMYAEHASDVADVLGNAHQMAQSEEAVEDIQESISSARRDLFPELTEEIVLDIDEDPFDGTESVESQDEAVDDESPAEADDAVEVGE